MLDPKAENTLKFSTMKDFSSKKTLLVIFSSLALAALVISCATSPTGRKQLIFMPDGEMNQMGYQAFDDLKKKTPLSRNSNKVTYVRCVANAITAITQDTTGVKSWEVQVFEDKSANAFALPGGKIGVHTGLLDVAKTPDQLAA